MTAEERLLTIDFPFRGSGYLSRYEYKRLLFNIATAIREAERAAFEAALEECYAVLCLLCAGKNSNYDKTPEAAIIGAGLDHRKIGGDIYKSLPCRAIALRRAAPVLLLELAKAVNG